MPASPIVLNRQQQAALLTLTSRLPEGDIVVFLVGGNSACPMAVLEALVQRARQAPAAVIVELVSRDPLQFASGREREARYGFEFPPLARKLLPLIDRFELAASPVRHWSGALSYIGWLDEPYVEVLPLGPTLVAIYGQPSAEDLAAALRAPGRQDQGYVGARRRVVVAAWTPTSSPPALPPGITAHVVVVEPPSSVADDNELDTIRALVGA